MRFHLLILFPLLALMTLAAPHIVRADITTGLVGHWTFDNTANDASGQGNHGTFNGGTPSYQTGQINQALSLDGVNDYVAMGDPTVLDFINETFTLSAWIKTSAASDQMIIYHGGDSTDRPGYTMRVLGSLGGKLNLGSANSSAAVTGPLSNASVNNGSWRHVVITSNGPNTMSMYIDGTQDASGGGPLDFANNTQTFAIGARVLSGGALSDFFLNSLIDDVRIYNRALSQSDITELFNFTGAQPSVTTNKSSYTAGETITVTVNNGLSNTQEWVGLYTSTAHDDASHVEWKFLNNTNSPPASPVSYPATLTFTAPITAGNYNLRLFGDESYANKLATSANITVSAPSDTTNPTVSLTEPITGATVSNTIPISANASDNVGVVGVQFLLDGANLGAEDTTSPYSISWNTTTATNGSHTLTARARDGAGNVTTSSAVNVTVSNGGSGDTTPPSDPSNLAASAVSSSRIDLTWSASSDAESGIANYEVYRCQGNSCTPTTLIASPTGTGYSDTNGLLASTFYSYRVRAKNGAGFHSTGYSNTEVEGTMAASSFSISASPTTVNTNTSITVSWTAPAGQTSAQDWVAIYAQGATNEQFNDWKYTGGATSGSLQLTTPATAGTYEVRYLLNDGFTHAAVSNSITVTASSGSFIENLATQVLATNGYLGGATSPAAVTPQFGSNKIFLSYLTNNTTSTGPRDIMAKMYDYATGQWTTTDVASIPHTGNDGHNAPSIHMSPQGYLEIYYGSIACGFSSYNPLTLDSRGGPCYKRSTSPYSITWGAEQRVPIPGGLDAQRGGFTPDGTIHLFGPVNNGMGYIRRTSSGTWSPLYLLVYAGLGSAVGTPGAMYDTQIIGSTIHVTWSTYNGSGAGRGIYYIKSSDGGVTWTNVNGTASFLAVNGLQPTGYVSDPSWHPTLGYPEWPSAYRIRTGAVASQPQVNVLPDGASAVAETGDGGFKIQKWTGSAWQATTIHSDWPTDIELNTLNNGNSAVHTTSLNTSNVYEYISTNNGANWSQTLVYQKGGEWRNGGLGSVLGSPPGQKQRVILQWNKFLEFPDRNEIAMRDRPIGGIVQSSQPLVGDLNSDGTVNTLDWGIMNADWFTSNTQSDINGDGLVNSIDFGLMNQNWGSSS